MDPFHEFLIQRRKHALKVVSENDSSDNMGTLDATDCSIDAEWSVDSELLVGDSAELAAEHDWDSQCAEPSIFCAAWAVSTTL